MVLGPRLDLRQSQSLVMTPQLQQAIKLLQMSNVELTEYIEQEIEQNPLLEREEADGGFEEDSREAPENEGASENADGDANFDGDGDIEALEPEDPAYDDVDTLPDSADHATSESMGEDDRSLDTDFENVYEPESASDGAAPEAAGDDGDGPNWSMAGSGGGGFDDELSGLENVAAEEITLRDHLVGQVNIDFEDPIEIMLSLIHI